MAEYIERSVAKEELLSWARCIKHPEHLMTEDAMCVLDGIPTADVVEVVRCRECKKTDEGELAGQKFLFCTYPFGMKGGCMITDPNHFCAYGVRKN